MIDVLNKYLECENDMFVLEYKGMIKNSYEYLFKRFAKNIKDLSKHKSIHVMLSSFDDDIAKIMEEPYKWWDFLYRQSTCETCWKIMIKIFDDETKIPQCYYEMLEEPAITDKIIAKYDWNSDKISNIEFSRDTHEPVYEINLWFKHGENFGDKSDYIKTLISEYENSLTEENSDE